MRKLIILLVLVSFNSFSIAQSWTIGANVGRNYSTWIPINDWSEALSSLNAGLSGTYQFNHLINFKSEINYERKGIDKMDYTRKLTKDEIVHQTDAIIFTDNLTIPLLVEINVPCKRFSFFANAGTYFGFLLKARAYGNHEHIFENPEDNYVYHWDRDVKQYYNDVDFGVVTGLGVNYRVYKKFSLCADFRYSRGLVRAARDHEGTFLFEVPHGDFYNAVQTFRAGIAVDL